MKARVVPNSKKALHILNEKLGGSASVTVERVSGGKVLLVSHSGEFSFWVDLKRSSEWHVVFLT